MRKQQKTAISQSDVGRSKGAMNRTHILHTNMTYMTYIIHSYIHTYQGHAFGGQDTTLRQEELLK